MANFVLGRICAQSKCKQTFLLKTNLSIDFVTNKEVHLLPYLLQTPDLLQHYQNYLRTERIRFENSQRMFTTQDIDPYRLVENDLKDMNLEIKEELGRQTNNSKLLSVATYYLDGRGKKIRPMTLVLMARAINCHLKKPCLLPGQRQFAFMIEMVHIFGLLLDDIVDNTEMRRGKPSVLALWKHKQVIMAADFIMAVGIAMGSRIKDGDVIKPISRIFLDVVQAELMQEGLGETGIQSFDQYLNKTYLKTGSVLANSLKAVTELAGATEDLSEIAFQYGRNIGIAFQLINDLLDFVSTPEMMGKQAVSEDLKSGVATAPVFFACEQFPELNEMIIRRFENAGDAEKAFEMVHKSRGLEQTQLLAKKYCLEAVRLVSSLQDSPYQKGLSVVPHIVLNCKK